MGPDIRSSIIDIVKDFLQHEQEAIVFNRAVAVFVAVEILCAVTGAVRAGEVVEVESPCFQFLIAGLGRSCGVHAHEDPPVPSQDAVDVADITGVGAVQSIVEGDAAGV